MAISNAAQGGAFLGAVVLGGCLGILYDLFRILRARLRWKWLEFLLDLLFWLATAVSLFMYCVWAGGGEVRGYLTLGIFSGGVLYFFFLSWLSLKIGYKIADIVAFCIKIFFLPWNMSKWFGKKIAKKLKKLFPFSEKWYKIKDRNGEEDKVDQAGEGVECHETQTSKFSD